MVKGVFHTVADVFYVGLLRLKSDIVIFLQQNLAYLYQMWTDMSVDGR